MNILHDPANYNLQQNKVDIGVTFYDPRNDKFILPTTDELRFVAQTGTILD